MNTLTSYLVILSLIQCSQSVPFASDLEIFWPLPDGINVTSVRPLSTPSYLFLVLIPQQFRTTLEVPLHMSQSVYGNSIHAFSSYISTSSSQITDTFTAKDGRDSTYNITLDGIGENSNISVYHLPLAYYFLPFCIYYIVR
jgi:hypothetical protein